MIFQTPEALKSKELSLRVHSLKAPTIEVRRLLQGLQDTSTLHTTVTRTTRYLDNTYNCYKDYKIPRHYIQLLQGLQDTSTVHTTVTRTTRYLDTTYNCYKTTRYLDSTQSTVCCCAGHKFVVLFGSSPGFGDNFWLILALFRLCVCVCVCVCVTHDTARPPTTPQTRPTQPFPVGR